MVEKYVQRVVLYSSLLAWKNMWIEICIANFLINHMDDRLENTFIIFPYYIELGGLEIILDGLDRLESGKARM